MSEKWHFECLSCGERSEEGLNHGDGILLNVLEHVCTIRSLLDSDEYGYLEISMASAGTEPITFLMAHYGDGHDVVVRSEYGTIRRVCNK